MSSKLTGVLAMTPKHKTTREEKIAYTLRLLNSDQAGEIVAAVHALKRLLQSLGTDLDGLANGFEKILNGGGKAITQGEMQKAICRRLRRRRAGRRKQAARHDTTFRTRTASHPGKPSRCSCSATKIGSTQSITTLSTTWPAAPRSDASRPSASTSTCIACSTSLVERSHEHSR